MCLQQHPLVGSVCSDASPGFPTVEANNVCCFSSTHSLISPVGNRLTLGSSLITYLLRASGFPCHLIDSKPDPISSARKSEQGNLSCKSRLRCFQDQYGPASSDLYSSSNSRVACILASASAVV